MLRPRNYVALSIKTHDITCHTKARLAPAVAGTSRRLCLMHLHSLDPHLFSDSMIPSLPPLGRPAPLTLLSCLASYALIKNQRPCTLLASPAPQSPTFRSCTLNPTWKPCILAQISSHPYRVSDSHTTSRCPTRTAAPPQSGRPPAAPRAPPGRPCRTPCKSPGGE